MALMIRPTSAWAHNREGSRPRVRIRSKRGIRLFLGVRCKVESGRGKVEDARCKLLNMNVPKIS
jgi:hypothetical protein